MKAAVDPKVQQRRVLVRGALVIVYVGLLCLTYVLGKGHNLIIDNKDLEDGSIMAAQGGLLVSIDGKEAMEVYPGDRLMERVKGQGHTVSVESLSGGDKIAKSLMLPLEAEYMLLSVPKLQAGKEPFLEPFTPLVVPRQSDQSLGEDNSFTSPDAPLVEPGLPIVPAP